MASRRAPNRTITLVLAGVAGVVLAHGLDYLLAVRSAAARAQELAETGHAWWPTAVGAAVGAACLAVSMATARGAAGAVTRRALDAAGTPVRRELAWMVLWQTGLFTAVEVIERLAAHRSPLELVHGPLFPVGIVLQVVVAALVVGGLRLVERVGATVAVALAGRGRARARRPAFVPVPPALCLATGTAGPHDARGPPLRLLV
jgi:hypothetical protein